MNVVFQGFRQMKKLCFLVPCLLFWATFTGAYVSYASDPLRILTVNEPPSTYVDSTGQVVGFSIDVVEEIQRRINDTTPIELVPEKRLLSIAEQYQNAVIVGISRTPSRENEYLWITKLLTKPWVLYSYRNHNSGITSLNQAKKLKVGVVHGDVREEYARDNGFEHIKASSDHLLNLKKLMLRRLDLIFYEPQGLTYLCTVNGFDASDFRSEVVPYVSEVYVAMSKDSGPDIFARWEKAAQDMKRDGTFFSLAAKWSGYLRQAYGISSEPTDESLIFNQ